MDKAMQSLTRQECFEHLQRHPVNLGRIAIAGPRPVILPVNYAIDGEGVVFRTDPGTKFHAAVHKAFVAFEVDSVEPEWETGWSVLIRGQAKVVEDPKELERLRGLPLTPWADGTKDSFVRIEAKLVSGRRLAGADATSSLSS
jgi:nitroimidazol reductase NimA-like FMN-containing flavoprotein (pyridoxamine 5'-phosphate oxidase superfamily)